MKLNWANADCILHANNVCELLADVNISIDSLLCSGVWRIDHTAELEKYYCDIKQCLHTAASRCIPCIKTNIQKHWWTPELNELKQQH